MFVTSIANLTSIAETKPLANWLLIANRLTAFCHQLKLITKINHKIVGSLTRWEHSNSHLYSVSDQVVQCKHPVRFNVVNMLLQDIHNLLPQKRVIRETLWQIKNPDITYILILILATASSFMRPSFLKPFFSLFMQLARHTRPEGHFKVWATIIFCQRPLPPTPRAETGLPLLQSM